MAALFKKPTCIAAAQMIHDRRPLASVAIYPCAIDPCARSLGRAVLAVRATREQRKIRSPIAMLDQTTPRRQNQLLVAPPSASNRLGRQDDGRFASGDDAIDQPTALRID